MTTIRTPQEIALANRLKDEAADDAWLSAWVKEATKALDEYRGRSILVTIPEIKCRARFLQQIQNIFEPYGWTTSIPCGACVWFDAIPDFTINPDLVKPDATDFQELPEPIHYITEAGIASRLWVALRKIWLHFWSAD